MFILGLTGSLGMGKSTTARFFAEQGVPVHDADAAVHRLYEAEAAPLIEAAFPGTTADGKVDREKLATRVLGDRGDQETRGNRASVGARRASEHFSPRRKRSGAQVAVLDIPLLFETGGERRCDAVVVVSAPARRAAHPRFRAAGHDRTEICRDCRQSRCRMRKSASALISSWIPRKASTLHARRYVKFLRESLQCQSDAR